MQLCLDSGDHQTPRLSPCTVSGVVSPSRQYQYPDACLPDYGISDSAVAGDQTELEVFEGVYSNRVSALDSHLEDVD
jgi:hypothetical protein